jgi:hypothetical protein
MRKGPVLAGIALGLLAASCDRPASQAPKAAATQAARPVPPPSDSRDPRRVLVAWAKAVSLRSWDEAYGYWADGGKGSGLTLAQFGAEWGKLAAPELEIREGRSESAAGSLFYTAPVTLVDGARRIEGKVVLRKANALPGATPEQSRWVIESTTLRP